QRVFGVISERPTTLITCPLVEEQGFGLMDAGFQAREFESGSSREILKLFEDAATQLQAAELRQDKHSFDLRILTALIDERAAAGDLAIHAGSHKSHVGLPEPLHRQQVITLRRI